MDKKTAFKILNLETTVSFETAQKAYRNLAKKYHPDVVGRKVCRKTDAEAKMKEINLAFRYLAPLLSTRKSVRKIKEKKKPQPPARKIKSDFLSKWMKIIFTVFSVKKHDRSFRQTVAEATPLKKTPLKETNGKTIRFDDVFKNVYQDDSGHGRKSDRQKKKKYSPKDHPYKRYQKYMALKRKMRSGASSLNSDTGIGRINKIRPVESIKPVNPVGRK